MVFQVVKELESIAKILMQSYRQRLLKCRSQAVGYESDFIRETVFGKENCH